MFGYPGDIRYLGDPNGILPLDRPHQFKVFGNYDFRGLTLGLGVNVSSGKPLTALDPNPNYSNGGEIPDTPRGQGIQTVNRFETRTPVQSAVDVQAAYRFNLTGGNRIAVMADIFSVFNQQQILDYDAWTALTCGAPPNPNFGLPVTSVLPGNPPQYQTPRQIRFGLRFEF